MIWSLHGGILLPPTCKINHVAFQHIPVYMRHIYVNVQLNSVNMQHNFVIMLDNYVNMHLNFPVCWHKKVAILHVDIIYLACRGEKYPTICFVPVVSKLNIIELCWILSYDGITSLCGDSSGGEVWKVFVYVHGGTDAALSVYIHVVKSHFVCFLVRTCNILFTWKWQQSECVDTKISSITEDSIQKMLGMMNYF
mgnify:CR=1 FL=1